MRKKGMFFMLALVFGLFSFSGIIQSKKAETKKAEESKPILEEEQALEEEPIIEEQEPLKEEQAVSPSKPELPTYRLHEVKPGEHLHLISAYYYGDARQWVRIYELNKSQIRNPNRIRVGQILKVEVPENWQPQFNLEEFIARDRQQQLQRQATTPKKGKTAKAGESKPTVIRERTEVMPTVVPRMLEEGATVQEQAPAPPPLPATPPR